ncbi:hypothetical protein G6514_010455 [Epicoccum nigrum]|nr:hypothetical protein G6514_010455 [Epicoccum nigrum]
MADPRQYYVPSGGALNCASSNPPPMETRQLQSSLRAGWLQRKQTAASTSLPKPKRQQHVSWTGDQRSSPAASVAAPKESSLETQPVVTGELLSPSIVDQQHSSPEKDSQMSNGSNAVIRDQLMTAVEPQNSASNATSKQSLENGVQDDTISGKAPKLRRKESFKKSWGRARNKVSSALLGGPLGLRSYVDEQSAAKGADHSMAMWRSFMAERERCEMALEGSFDSFQDAMEGAMDLKYRELRGEGGFLIHEEASTFLTGQSNEVPTQDEPVGLTA